MTDAYTAAGVNVDVEAEASRIMFEAAKKTFVNREGDIGEIVMPFDDFSGLKCVMIDQLPEGSCMSLGFDGVGTKVLLPQRLHRYSTIAFDLFAMLTDDAVVRGAEPALVGSVLDVTSFGNDKKHLAVIRELAAGMVAAAKDANVAVINGEIAQLGACISGEGPFPFNWAGACIWFARRDRLITGRDIQPGQQVILLRERGPRSNGLSLLRRHLADHYGPAWHESVVGGSTLGDQMLTPSTIYTKLIVHLTGGFYGNPICPVAGVVHITGGGIPEKFGRVLRPSGYGVDLDNLWDPPAIMTLAQRVGDVPDQQAYRALNMGQGMGIIVDRSHVGFVLASADHFGFEMMLGGEISAKPGVRLKSQGYFSKGGWLSFG